jgi:hypothetical protein
MIRRLDDFLFQDEDRGLISRKPTLDEIIEKINEIIIHLNEQEEE